jgi:hypothetical protein
MSTVITNFASGLPRVSESLSQTTNRPQLDRLMLFGFLAAVITLACCVEHRPTRSWRIAFAICTTSLAVYTFLQGAWPAGIVLIAWSGVALRRGSSVAPARSDYEKHGRQSPAGWRFISPASRVERPFGSALNANWN